MGRERRTEMLHDSHNTIIMLLMNANLYVHGYAYNYDYTFLSVW